MKKILLAILVCTLLLGAVPLALACTGKVTGGGQIVVPGGVASFGFNAMYFSRLPPGDVMGELEYNDHTGFNVHAHIMTWIWVDTPNPPDELPNQPWPYIHAVFRGPCTIDGEEGYRFEVNVYDHGEPGTGDAFVIKVWEEGDGVNSPPFGESPPINPALLIINAGDYLLNGNIQIHKPPK